MEELRKTIVNLIHLNKEQIDYILTHFESRILTKDNCFVNFGERCDEVAFLKSGIIRFYYLSKYDEQTTCYFALPNEFITSIKSFNFKKNSREVLQAITDCELFVIKRKNLEKIYAEFPSTQLITQRVYETLSINLQKRIALLQINSAEERYDYLQFHQSVLLKNVPLQYLASFLGVTPQHLSRLRKSKTTA